MVTIHRSPLPDVDVPDIPITEMVLRRAKELPDRVAITDGASNTYTFSELSDAIHSFASAMDAIPPSFYSHIPLSTFVPDLAPTFLVHLTPLFLPYLPPTFLLHLTPTFLLHLPVVVKIIFWIFD